MELENCNKDEIMQLTDLQKQISQQNTSHEAIDLKLDAQDRSILPEKLCPRLFRCPEEASENTDVIVLKVGNKNVDVQLEEVECSHAQGGSEKKTFFFRWRTSSTRVLYLGAEMCDYGNQKQ